MSKVKKIHFVGIKGVGMTPLAIIAKEAGIEVTGSDVKEKFITDEELKTSEIKVLEGFKKENIDSPDLVVYTGAHSGEKNIEVVFAKEKGIRCLNQGQALGEFQKGEIIGREFEGISVAGSHGKTSTTAILATILKYSKKDPSYVIGTGEIPSLGKSGHLGKGDYFITESDEYFADISTDRTPKFLYQHPHLCIFTNVDYDHPDIFENYQEIENAYLKFSENLKQNGVLVICGDGDKNRKFISKVNARKITYGLSPDNDFVLEKVSQNPDGMFFWVKRKDSMIGQFSMKVFGEHNAKNALSAVIAGLEIGLSVEDIKNSLKEYQGAKRRMEKIGVLDSGAILYDDYAHHPEEIKQTLASFKKAFPNYKIITVFQPHMYSRTKKLLDDFVMSFENSDETILSEIFPSFREKIDENFSSKVIADKLNERGKKSTYFRDSEDVLKYLSSQNYDSKTILLTMGAGNIYKIGEYLING